MPNERDDLQTTRWQWVRSVTVVLIALNIVAYIFQSRFLPKLTDPFNLELSWWGLRQGWVWQLLTYQFMHGNVLHLVLNCWPLLVFGRGVEWAVGKTRFLLLYLSCGIMGGLVQVAASMLWPDYFAGATLGASAAVFGVVAAFAMIFPEQQLVMLLLYVIPINIRAKWLLWFVLFITALGITFYKSQVVQTLLGGNVAHFGHLGGILTGIAFARFYFLKHLPPPQPSE